MPRVYRHQTPPEALEYLRSFRLEPGQIEADSWDQYGYYVAKEHESWEHQYVRWPSGFNYDHFVKLTNQRVSEENVSFKSKVDDVLTEIADTLVSKNKAYGDSALNPSRIFSKASAEEQLLVRIDDKISRIQRGHEYGNEDTVKDLIGYLILLTIARSDAGESSE